ncbi:MAG: hypothetical protein C4323_04350 [Mastigocladus sp. ERB_26_2]
MMICGELLKQRLSPHDYRKVVITPFWIGNCFTCLDSINRSVAFFFQAGIIFIKPQLIFGQKF